MNEVPLDVLTSGATPIVKTVDVLRSIDGYNSWLHPDNRQPFILVGPSGCGKRWVKCFAFW
jgi:dynein heavy chain 2